MGDMDTGREPTLKDVARRADVHPSTASRSLDPLQLTRIGKATRERVLLAARELGYQPHIAAGSLRSRRSRTVGVLISELSNPIYAALLAGITGRLESDGYTAIIFETRGEQERMAQALRILGERRVDAVINAAARTHDQRCLKNFIRKGIPMVLAARDVSGLQVPRVLNDDLKGGWLAAEHLLSLGHEQIVQITGPPGIASLVERGRGFRSAIAQASSTLRVHDVQAREVTFEEGRRLTRAVLRRHELPSAIFAHNDFLAIGAMVALREAGMNCPDDVSVIGYNNTPLVEYLDPPLTTVLFPAAELGNIAAETVLSMLRGVEPRFVLALQPQLVVRQSTSIARIPVRRVG